MESFKIQNGIYIAFGKLEVILYIHALYHVTLCLSMSFCMTSGSFVTGGLILAPCAITYICEPTNFL